MTRKKATNSLIKLQGIIKKLQIAYRKFQEEQDFEGVIKKLQIAY